MSVDIGSPRCITRKLAAIGFSAGMVFTASGCATSGAMTLISLGMSGISLATTGKSVSDHALSVVLERDCSFFRPISGEPICAEPVGTVSDADDSPPVATDIEHSAAYAHAVPAGTAAAANEALSISAGSEETQTFTVLGSFRDVQNAERLVAKLGERWAASVATARLERGVVHRVVIDLSMRLDADLDIEMAAQEIMGSWTLTLCSTSMLPPPCPADSTLLAGLARPISMMPK
ncbi:MAG: hypothetical protein ACI8PT_001654 [Gammaproteobacteria bacterium]|jgi:hypothetical protein